MDNIFNVVAMEEVKLQLFGSLMFKKAVYQALLTSQGFVGCFTLFAHSQLQRVVCLRFFSRVAVPVLSHLEVCFAGIRITH